MTKLFSALVLLACLALGTNQTVAAPASGLTLLKSNSAVQEAGYRYHRHHRHHRCWWRHGHRHCRWW
jgi:hypothetical protein